MKTVNKAILVGRLGADPILRQTKNGHPVANFSLATDRPLIGTDEPETQWHQVVVWGRLGEVCNQYLKKGQLTYVEGEIRTQEYNGSDGVSRRKTEVHASEVHFLGGKKASALVAQEGAEAIAQ